MNPHVTVIPPDARNEALRAAKYAIEYLMNNGVPLDNDYSGFFNTGANVLQQIDDCIGGDPLL